MKNNKKSSLSFVMALVMIVASLSISVLAYGDDAVAINATNFPDKNFRAIISEECDVSPKDGFLSAQEREAVGSYVSVTGWYDEVFDGDEEIETIKGIELFTDVDTLHCGGIGLTTLDVSQMPQLVTLTCGGNNLTSLDLSNNVNLTTLNCSSNDLTSLDLSNNTALKKLECNVNELTSLDVSMLSELTSLRCSNNKLTTLDLSSNTNLTTFNCASNNMLALDLSNNQALGTVTEQMIGDQQYTATTVLDGDYLVTSVDVPNADRILTTSLDRTQSIDGVDVYLSGYENGHFVANDVDSIKDGIFYTYDTGLETAEAMTVNINVVRDFYQVKYYSSSDKQLLLATVLVNSGESAQQPEITDVPQCKAFDSWSDDVSSVTDDMEVWAIWKDAHNLVPKTFDEKTRILDAECTECAIEYEYLFDDMINAEYGDKNYVAVADTNADGIINAKDFAMLTNLY